MKVFHNHLDKGYLTEFLKEGNYILSLCEDKETDNEWEPIEHHLPLIDPSKLWIDANNWNLSKIEKRKVKDYQDDLKLYASGVVRAYRETDSEIPEILPLWIVFPIYSAVTIGWRMGLGEEYEIIYNKMLKGMTTNERTAYKSKYPAPKYMAVRSGYDYYQ